MIEEFDRVTLKSDLNIEVMPWVPAYSKIGVFRVLEVSNDGIATIHLSSLQEKILKENLAPDLIEKCSINLIHTNFLRKIKTQKTI